MHSFTGCSTYRPPEDVPLAVAAALNETASPHMGGRIELSRPLHHPQLLPLVGEVGQRLGFSIEVV